MANIFIIILGKTIALIARFLNLGSGSTWPGHIALTINKNFIKDLLKNQKIKIVLIAGTNGKTTTGKLIQTILEKDGKKVFQNSAGANLLNGIASSIILHSNILGGINYDFAVFEIDENTLPLILRDVNPDYLLLLNLFRDQLDRYGEVNTIAQKWQKAISSLTPQTSLILNADDPQIAYLSWYHLFEPEPIRFLESESRNRRSEPHGRRPQSRRPERSEGSRVFYFGLNDPSLTQKTHQHAADSTYCPKCQNKLTYKVIYYSHAGEWQCKNCNLKRPKLNISNSPIFPLSGIYNKYNTLAALLLAQLNNVNNKTIEQSLRSFQPAFGRQEMLEIDDKKVQIFLSKNPTSFNESLRTIKELGAKSVLFVLNDRIPDGRDVSWIWDVDFEEYVSNFKDVTVSGDRAYDMGLRIKYTFQNQKSKIKNQNYKSKVKIYENISEAVRKTMEQSNNKNNDVLYILPTYSAMLDVRRILTGKKIL